MKTIDFATLYPTPTTGIIIPPINHDKSMCVEDTSSYKLRIDNLLD